MNPTLKPINEFHISRQARDYYQFDQALFATNGNVIFTNFHAARVFSQKMNDRRDLISYPEQAVRAGQINAMGLIDEIMHLVIEAYREQRNPKAIAEALAYLDEQVGKQHVDDVLKQFINEFPPISVYRREHNVDKYLEGESQNSQGEMVPNRVVALEEILTLWLANANPAFSPFMELFDDSNLAKSPAYSEVIEGLQDFFDEQPPFGPDYQNLIEMMQSPAIAEPHSLSGQLEYIRNRWGYLLGKFLYRLLSSLDLIKEEEKAIFGLGGGGPSYVLEFGDLDLEIERFSPDKDWMPNLVLIAKNSYVWLDQLSRKYKRAITTLDQIPDEELDQLARWGVSGLWLIGLWERSLASKRIKQLRGNPEAVASAYSLLSYEIAGDLGGEAAYERLRERAWQRGIRLASDMVPNHMGIDSRWVIEHPDWFISLDYSPFPSYTFNGPNLSWDERVGLYIEDHYFDNTDAAVVFKRVDFWTGSEKYVYHGNDGTSMPWNDTAQLNYLLPEVREAVIQTILHVARKFSVIRFDAAMTLAKKHYQRLWFPEPGSGGDIPSRAEHGLTKAQFDEAFPTEFWREVVDRVAQEVPDTLLLAEAFWLMEGYFVRTLGMHRVYNSAFMNMLRDEKNQEYRLVIKNTLEFDPEILKRYVNFMNNPDERTAVDQFGKGDKYFGICTLMATIPGLPMFGHGQIEGYTEKYGMEYRRAYWDEKPDPYLVERHEREIFPLLRKRWLFSNMNDFLLYDFYTPGGSVNEDVFAYSNRAGDQRSLVVYHNKYAETRGWIRTSAAYLDKSSSERILRQKSLGEGLGLGQAGNEYVIFREQVSGLEYIRNCAQIHDQGMYLELHAYQTYVFLDFRQVQDNEWNQYAQLAGYLDGRGVPSIDEAIRELYLQPLSRAYRELVNPGMLEWLIANRLSPEGLEPESYAQAFEETEQKLGALLAQVRSISGGGGDLEALKERILEQIGAALALPALSQRYPMPESIDYHKALRYLSTGPADDATLGEGNPDVWATLLVYLLTSDLGQVYAQKEAGGTDPNELSRTWIDEWLLGKIIAETLTSLGTNTGDAWQRVRLIKLLIGHQEWCQAEADEVPSGLSLLRSWLKDTDMQNYLGVNRHQDVLWYNKEAFEDWLWWAYTARVVAALAGAEEGENIQQSLINCYKVVESLQAAEEVSDYKVEKLLEATKE